MAWKVSQAELRPQAIAAPQKAHQQSDHLPFWMLAASTSFRAQIATLFGVLRWIWQLQIRHGILRTLKDDENRIWVG
jgi:hypothetical protein